MAIKNDFSDAINDYVKAFNSGEPLPSIHGNDYVDSYTAMKYSAVFACCRVLAETFASMPVMLYQKDKNGDRKALNDLDIYDILHSRPNDEMSPFNFKESMMMSLNLGGNSVSEKLFNRFGDVVGLYPYRWQQVKIDRDENNRLIYKITNGKESKTLNREQVLHIPGLSLDGIVGLSPIEYSASAINLGLSYEKFGIGFYKNGANASGAFTFPNELGDEAFGRLKEEVKKNYTGLKNTGTPIILEGGGSFQPFTIKPADAQLIESKRFQIEDICRIYRVPQHLVQMLEKSTNNNIEHQSLEFVMYTMLPWFKRVEENLNMQMLSPKERKAGYYLEFKIDALLRGDAKSRAEAYATGRLNGWLSINDIRKLENMNPVEGGDEYMQPLNYINIKLADDYYKDKSKKNEETKNELSKTIEEMIKK
jgi:HK97 family phage portal protein